ncbi:MAG: hypothetical protein LBL90_11585 [Prevotellaceae bacterium]|jgi:IS1 family transposase|nr:hypothetical protein [Prevotellaceae bacterium]
MQIKITLHCFNCQRIKIKRNAKKPLFGANGNENSPRLEEKLPALGVNRRSIVTDDWHSFAVAFKGGNHRAGKKYTVGIGGG